MRQLQPRSRGIRPDAVVRRYRPSRGVQVHPAEVCERPCAVHAPSDHPMVRWHARMRTDPGGFPLIERLCPEHGVGHPDPDSLAHLVRATRDSSWGVHGCCGCCAGPQRDGHGGGGAQA